MFLYPAVCAAAGIDCRMVWDKYQNCVNSKESKHMLGGKGIYHFSTVKICMSLSKRGTGIVTIRCRLIDQFSKKKYV